MCGAFSTPASWSSFNFSTDDSWAALDNKFAVRPYDPSVIICHQDQSMRAGLAQQWSLVPPFADSQQLKYSTFNARLDRLETSPVWKSSFPDKRCLVPADGFFERVKEEGQKKKRPYYIHRRDQRGFCFAGLWSKWHDDKNNVDVLSFTIITTMPNSLMKKIGHHRMPCIVAEQDYEKWLNPETRDPEILSTMIAEPMDGDLFIAHKVGYEVNYRKINGPEIVKPID
ncbi:MAG: SOS response-associated peptidase [Planctomycetota bacterium]|jgi:putative SOS response-associated peptidase YedK|nr:SOS response-associated peptidase [Planctomycetota bacterium]